ncbi:MAG: hypothetical protein K8S87_08825 [Planctomycetes bacterium]|nr:hypothetical protein [Planctomycetota bacterium]
MKRYTPKSIRNDGIITLIVGLLLLIVSSVLLIFYFEDLRNWGFASLVLGLYLFIDGTHRAVNYKEIVDKIISEANPDTVYNINTISEDITDELVEQILTAKFTKKPKEKLITPKHRKRDAYLSLIFGLLFLTGLVTSVLHERQPLFQILLFEGIFLFSIINGYYKLKTMRKYKRKYFKDKTFAIPMADDDSILIDNTEEYLDDLVYQEQDNLIASNIAIILVIALIILTISAYFRSFAVAIVIVTVVLSAFGIIFLRRYNKFK